MFGVMTTSVKRAYLSKLEKLIELFVDHVGPLSGYPGAGQGFGRQQLCCRLGTVIKATRCSTAGCAYHCSRGKGAECTKQSAYVTPASYLSGACLGPDWTLSRCLVGTKMLVMLTSAPYSKRYSMCQGRPSLQAMCSAVHFYCPLLLPSPYWPCAAEAAV